MVTEAIIRNTKRSWNVKISYQTRSGTNRLPIQNSVIEFPDEAQANKAVPLLRYVISNNGADP